MWGSIFSFILLFFTSIFKRKAQGEKAIDTVVKEREKALESVKNANEVRDKLVNDPDYRDWMYRKYKRKDD